GLRSVWFRKPDACATLPAKDELARPTRTPLGFYRHPRFAAHSRRFRRARVRVGMVAPGIYFDAHARSRANSSRRSLATDHLHLYPAITKPVVGLVCSVVSL